MNKYIILLRPHLWIKNLFVFSPLFFAIKLKSTDLLINSIIAFFAFSFVASAVYVLNDYFDYESDKKHPVKKNRPIASDSISKKSAVYMFTGILIAGLLLGFFLNTKVFLSISVYFIINIFYTLKLKHIAILDVSCISVGFVLRLFTGSFATDIVLSKWIIIITFLLALFLALSKRRDDMLIFINSGKKMREAIDGYNLSFLDYSMVISSPIVIISYIMYTVSPEVIEKTNTEYLYLTTLFVIIGILRYMQLIFVNRTSKDPTAIVINDRFLQLTIIGWIISFIVILY